MKIFKIFKNAATLYVMGSFLVQGVALLTTPLFTRIMTPGDYGVLAVYTLWVAIFGTIIGLQVNGSIINAKIQYGEDKLNGYLSSVMTISVASFLFFLMISLLFKDFLSGVLKIKETLIPIMMVQCFFSFTISFMNSKFVALKKPFRFFALSAASALLNVGLSLLFVTLLESEKYLGRIYASTLVNTLIGITCLLIILIKGKKFIQTDYWKFCLPLTLPLIVHNLSNLILNQADRYILSVLTDDTTTGIYSFAYTLGSVISVIWLAINNAWVPWYFEKTKANKTDEIVSMQKLYNFVFVSLTVGFILVSPEFVRLMGPLAFRYGAYLTPMIAASCFFMYLYSFAVNHEFYHRKTFFISVGTLFAALVNILSNYLLIPRIGSMGAAVATLVSYMLLFAFHYGIAKFLIKNFQIPFKQLLFPGLIVLGALGFFYLCFDLWLIRWLCALAVLVFLLVKGISFLKKGKPPLELSDEIPQ